MSSSDAFVSTNGVSSDLSGEAGPAFRASERPEGEGPAGRVERSRAFLRHKEILVRSYRSQEEFWSLKE